MPAGGICGLHRTVMRGLQRIFMIKMARSSRIMGMSSYNFSSNLMML